MIRFSAPGKIHLLGEHTVVYGKPAILTTINLRAFVSISPTTFIPRSLGEVRPISSIPLITKTIESIIKKYLKIKIIPPYNLEISSQIPIGTGLGSSTAISASYIAALLSFLKVKWDLNLINQLTFEAEKVFHGNPSGGDNSTSIFGGLVWFRKELPDLKLIQQIPFSIPKKLAKNFIFINTGKPKETTKQMVELVNSRFKIHNSKFQKNFDHQEQLVKDLLLAIQTKDEAKLIQIIRAGEKNLEKIGVVSPFVKFIIRKVEKSGGAGKICGGGGKTKATGILLCYHQNPNLIKAIAKATNLKYFKCQLGTEGLRNES